MMQHWRKQCHMHRRDLPACNLPVHGWAGKVDSMGKSCRGCRAMSNNFFAGEALGGEPSTFRRKQSETDPELPDIFAGGKGAASADLRGVSAAILLQCAEFLEKTNGSLASAKHEDLAGFVGICRRTRSRRVRGRENFLACAGCIAGCCWISASRTIRRFIWKRRRDGRCCRNHCQKPKW